MSARGVVGWRIDAIDARAGFAFASLRSEGVEVAAADLPAAFFVGPDFQPARLSDRVPGLAAARRSFQRGFFHANDEVTFTTLDDVAEFTRRCYLRGGGGDGTDRGGRGPPPEPAGEHGPPLPPLPEDFGRMTPEEAEEGPSFTVELRRDAKRFWEVARQTSGGDGHPVDWRRDMPIAAGIRPPPQVDGPECLARAATLLAYEFLRRLPGNGKAEDFIRWRSSARRLGDVVGRLGLWPLMAGPLSSSMRAVSQQFRTTFTKDVEEFAGHFPEPEVAAAIWGHFLFGERSTLPFFGPEFSWYSRWPETSSDGDPMDVLEAIPVPRDVTNEVHILTPHSPGNVALQDVLSAVLGSPPDGLSQRVIDLVLFAASCITTTAEQSVPDDPLWLGRRIPVSPLRRRAIAGIAGRAKEWLAAQLPRRVFGEPVEHAIRDSTNLVGYRDKSPSGTAGMPPR